MKNPNSPASRLKQELRSRWSGEDYPGAKPRFQLALFAKDVATFVLVPVAAVILAKACDHASNQPRKATSTQQSSRDPNRLEASKSQIIEFKTHSGGGGSGFAGVPKRSPGALVRVRLLNVVETYSTAPVHAQIVDEGLGQALMGGTLIGDATPDSTFERISITFRFARDPGHQGIAVPIAARALGLDGTLGLEATKKKGFVTRSAIGSANAVGQDLQGKGNGSTDFKDVLVKALTAGLIQEFGSSTQVEKNRGQVLTLRPGEEFFAELTDFFPGAAK